MAEKETSRKGILVRDFLIFQLKLALDGLKDVVVFQLSVVALLLDLVIPGRKRSLFYGLVRRTERFDLWLNLYGATEDVDDHPDGLFGTSEAGSDTLLGEVEAIARSWISDRRGRKQAR